jgi:hypothetical protein
LQPYDLADTLELGHRATVAMTRHKAPKASLIAVGAALRQVIVARDGSAA